MTMKIGVFHFERGSRNKRKQRVRRPDNAIFEETLHLGRAISIHRHAPNTYLPEEKGLLTQKQHDTLRRQALDTAGSPWWKSHVYQVYSRELMVSGNVITVDRYGEGTGITVGRSRAFVRIRAVACPVLHVASKGKQATEGWEGHMARIEVKSGGRCLFTLSASRLVSGIVRRSIAYRRVGRSIARLQGPRSAQTVRHLFPCTYTVVTARVGTWVGRLAVPPRKLKHRLAAISTTTSQPGNPIIGFATKQREGNHTTNRRKQPPARSICTSAGTVVFTCTTTSKLSWVRTTPLVASGS